MRIFPIQSSQYFELEDLLDPWGSSFDVIIAKFHLCLKRMYGNEKSNSLGYAPLLFALRNVARSKKRLRRLRRKEKRVGGRDMFLERALLDLPPKVLRCICVYRNSTVAFVVFSRWIDLAARSNTGHLSTRKMGPRCVLLARDKYVCEIPSSFNPKPLLLYLVHDWPPRSIAFFFFFFFSLFL